MLCGFWEHEYAFSISCLEDLALGSQEFSSLLYCGLRSFWKLVTTYHPTYNTCQ